MFRAYKVFLATAYPQSDLTGTMKRFLACLALCASLSASAQVVYPYNPDANGDSAITSSDLLDFLPVFATTFTPQVITIDGVPLDQWLIDLNSVINDLQGQLNAQDATIDSLQNAAMTRDSVRAIARGEAVFWGSIGHVDLEGVNLENSSTDSNNQFYLIGAYLSGTNLSGAQLSGADLSGADLSDANLSGVSLFYANFTGADLSGADLSGADLSYALLSGATMTCLNGCPSALPSGYICEPHPDCSEPDRYRIVED